MNYYQTGGFSINLKKNFFGNNVINNISDKLRISYLNTSRHDITTEIEVNKLDVVVIFW